MITVVGRRAGRDVVAFVLEHGGEPREELAARGWAAGGVAAQGKLGRLRLVYDVTPARPLPVTGGPQGPGLSEAERSSVVPRQRVAAYAVVVARRRLLLTQLSDRTGAQGRWNLPGGGLDPDESPAAGVVREVLEETGQVVDDVRLVEVMTQHWVGASVRGAEDYHAVRLLHTARCRRPTEAVVHDVGGSTSDARWVPLEDLGGVPVVASVPVALRAAGIDVGHRPGRA